MDCSLPGSSVHGISQARNGLEWLPFPFPGDLPNPESNPGVLHYRQILYQLSYEGNPWEKEMGEIWVWGLHSVNSVVSYWSIFRKRSDLCLGNLTALATWEAGNRAQLYPLHSSVGWTIISLVAVKGVLWSCRTLKSLEGLPRWHEVKRTHLPPDGAAVKNLPAKAGDTIAATLIPGSGRSPGIGNGTPSSILVWKLPWTEEPGRLQCMGPQRVGHESSGEGQADCCCRTPGDSRNLSKAMEVRKQRRAHRQKGESTKTDSRLILWGMRWEVKELKCLDFVPGKLAMAVT